MLASLTLVFSAASTAVAAQGGPELDRWVLLTWLASEVPGVLAADLDRGVRETARFQLGVELLTPEELFVEGGGEVQEALGRCAADVDCLAQALAPTRADAALLIVAREAGGRGVLAIRAIQVETAQIQHQAVRPLAAGEAPRALATELARETFAQLGYEEGGLLTIEARPLDAELSLAGPIDVRAVSVGRALLLRPGTYELRAERSGHEPALRRVRVDARESLAVELELVESRSVLSSPWLWAGVGAAAVAIGVSVAAIAVGGDRCYCAAADPSACSTCP